MGPRSKTSIGSDSRAHNEHPSDEQSRALPAESMVADSSLEDISMHGPKALTVAGVRKTLIQIMEDADLHDTGFHCMGEKGIGDAIMRTAHSHLKDQASLVAYVKYLEMSVASLRNSLQCDTASSTPSSPVAEPSVASIDDKRPDLLDNDAGRWIVEVKRWKELYNESEEPATKWSDDGLIHNDESEKERTTQSGHVLISYSLNNKNKVHIDTRLEINSTPLIQTLQRVIQVCSKVPLETLGQEQFILREPYMMIFHHYNQLCEEYSRLQGESKEHLGLLLDFVRDEWPKASETISRTIENDITEIGFGELWLLYSPGTIIYTKEDDEVRAYRVNGLNGFCRSQKMKGQFTGFEIECSWVRFNTSGNKLVETYKILHVSPYTGMQAIRDLEFVPAGYLPGESSQRELLIARGQRYWDYRDKGHFQSYFGTAWLTANPKVRKQTEPKESLINRYSLRMAIESWSIIVPAAERRTASDVWIALRECNPDLSRAFVRNQGETRNIATRTQHLKTKVTASPSAIPRQCFAALPKCGRFLYVTSLGNLSRYLSWGL